MSQKETKIISLFNNIQHGDRAAFDELFSFYYPKLVAFGRQYTKQLECAEEIASELFVKIWLKRDLLSEVLNPEVYLYISIKNACLNSIRADKRRIRLFTEEDVMPHLENMADRETTAVEDKELVRLLDNAVSLLPEQRRLIFKLIKEDGLKPLAVAQILGISKRTVENQLYKAIKALAEVVGVYLGYSPQSRTTRKQALSELSLIFFF